MPRMKQSVHVLRVPFGLGAGRPGSDKGPEAIWKNGLEKALKDLLVSWKLTDVTIPPPGTVTPAAVLPKHAAEVDAMSRQLAQHMKTSLLAKQFPLVLGGDHSIAIGTLAGIGMAGKTPGLIWFDAHADLNTELTSQSGNLHGMALAIGLGYGSNSSLTQLGKPFPRIDPQRVVIVGARDLDPAEKAFIRHEGITCFTMHDIDRCGMANIIDDALAIAGSDGDGIHISFDIDCVDPSEAPGTGTPIKGGLTYREAHLALEMLHESGIVRSAEFVEVNPALDSSRQTARLAGELIASLLGKSIR